MGARTRGPQDLLWTAAGLQKSRPSKGLDSTSLLLKALRCSHGLPGVLVH